MKVWTSVCFVAAAVTLAMTPVARTEVLIGSAAPLTGQMSWHGEQHQRGIELAVAELNAAGGVLGETVAVVTADDYCDGEQAVAAANKLIADRVDVVIGHNCSGAAIPASAVYEDVGIVMISNTATNPKLTDQGFRHISAWWPATRCRGRWPPNTWLNIWLTRESRSCTTVRPTGRVSPRRPRRS